MALVTRSTHSSKWCLTGAHCFDWRHSVVADIASSVLTHKPHRPRPLSLGSARNAGSRSLPSSKVSLGSTSSSSSSSSSSSASSSAAAPSASGSSLVSAVVSSVYIMGIISSRTCTPTLYSSLGDNFPRSGIANGHWLGQGKRPHRLTRGKQTHLILLSSRSLGLGRDPRRCGLDEVR